MASVHDPLLHLLRGDPSPLLHLVRARHPDLPTDGWSAASETFSRASLPERRPDLVLLHDDAQVVIIVELQNRRDERKLRTWPYYAAAAAMRHDRDALLVVVTLRRSVAAWARGPHASPWATVHPIVFGPDEMPTAGGPPALLLLAALARGARDRRLLDQAVAATATLDDDHAIAYLDLLREHLPGLAPRILEVMMSRTKGRTAGFQKFIEEFSRMVGREEGKVEGKVEGRDDARRDDIALLLRRLGREQELASLPSLQGAALERRYELLLNELITQAAP
ncbi:MAG TPA: hypothetical protein PKA64_05330 [Myxococcota bacterium]|nr:hypothetical protein [Myxococcota bacterium]